MPIRRNTLPPALAPVKFNTTDRSECRMRAAYYREMAATATKTSVRDALLRLAQRYEKLAGDKPA